MLPGNINAKYMARYAEQIKAYARMDLSLIEYEALEKSYKRGRILAYTYAIFMMVSLLVCVVLLIRLGSYSLGTYKGNNIIRYYSDGKYVDLDVSNTKGLYNDGVQYALIFDNQNRLDKIIAYEEFKEQRAKRLLLNFCTIIILMVGSFAVYTMVHRKLVAKTWWEYSEHYKEVKQGEVSSLGARIKKLPVTDPETVITLMGKHTQIKGGMSYITFVYENDYSMKAQGELRPGAEFMVYRSSMKKWNEPHENDVVDATVVAAIEKEVLESYREGYVKITFC